ncbi:MAG: RNA methyltransferase [Chitinophagaceae bacterium]|jgi:tRNA G18 (ribose-2'-O)-methylase SpoU|nr:RNA methyltransferase [Chitinophagaceae bacterium]
MAEFTKLSMNQLGRASAEEAKQLPKVPVVVVLDNVRSMHNVGSIFRSADAFAIQKLYLCGYTPQPPHRDIHKTALGATESVNWAYQTSALDCINQLKTNGYNIVSVEQATGSISPAGFTQNAPAYPVAIVLGNEVEGVQQAIIDLSNVVMEIPQFGAKHSLNVAVAGGIVMYELSSRYFV